MRDEFKPGPITAREARLLNEVLDVAEQFRRLTVAPPLFLSRAAGIPLLRLADPPGGDCPETGIGATYHESIPTEGVQTVSSLSGVVLPRPGKYLVWGNAAFRGRVSGAAPGVLLAQMCDRLTGGNEIRGPLLECSVPTGSGPYGNDWVETRSFTHVVTTTRADTELGWITARSTLASGSWTTSFIGSFGFGDFYPLGQVTSLGYLLLCELPAFEYGSGSDGSGGCDPIPLWDGAGWYCVFTGVICEAVELIDGDECDTSIIICSGPYADEATAIAGCGGPGSGPGTCGAGSQACACCPDTVQATSVNLTVYGGCGFASTPGTILDAEDPNPAGFTATNAATLRPGTEQWDATLFCADNGEGWVSDLVGPGGISVTGVLLGLPTCNDPDGPINVSFTYEVPALSGCMGGVTIIILWTLS